MDKYAKAAKLYINGGVDVITFLLSNGASGNPLRIDVAIPTSQDIDVELYIKKL